MKDIYKHLFAGALVIFVGGCLSTSDPMGADASAWANYNNWYKVTPEPNTGDPTGFLGGVHAGTDAYREIYVNAQGEATNRGDAPFPYPEGSIIVKESYNNQQAYENQDTPELTIMIKLAAGASPETADWEYVMGVDGGSRGTGTSGLATFCHSCHANAAETNYSFIHSQFYANN